MTSKAGAQEWASLPGEKLGQERTTKSLPQFLKASIFLCPHSVTTSQTIPDTYAPEILKIRASDQTDPLLGSFEAVFVWRITTNSKPGQTGWEGPRARGEDSRIAPNIYLYGLRLPGSSRLWGVALKLPSQTKGMKWIPCRDLARPVVVAAGGSPGLPGSSGSPVRADALNLDPSLWAVAAASRDRAQSFADQWPRGKGVLLTELPVSPKYYARRGTWSKMKGEGLILDSTYE